LSVRCLNVLKMLCKFISSTCGSMCEGGGSLS
jgi:hypothetical protein